MSSRSSYGSSYADKGAYSPRSSSPRSTASTSTTSSTQSYSTYANSSSSRNRGYGNKPPVVIQGGQSNDPNTSTSAPNSGYYN